MDLYENTLIGTFLYGLGMELGSRLGNTTLVSGVDLLQQTPLDQSLGDVLIKAPRYFRLFEFKRASNRDPKEATKRAHLLVQIATSADSQAMAATSTAIHRFVSIEHERRADSRVETRLAERSYVGGETRTRTISELCEETAEAMLVPPPNPTPGQCASYLRLLASLNDKLKNPTGGGGILLVAGRNGIIEYAHVAQITDVFRTHEQLIALASTDAREAEFGGGTLHTSGRVDQDEIEGVEDER